MTHIKVRNIFKILLLLCLLTPFISAQSCNIGAQLPQQLTLYTGETFRYYLLEYFYGSSMTFSTSTSLPSYSRIVPTYTSYTTSSNLIPAFVSYKIYKSQDSFYQLTENSMTFLIKNNTNYYVQAFTPQTATQPIQNLTGPISLNGSALPNDAICYDLTYISIGQILVDCYSPSKNLNYLVPVSLTAQIMLNNTQSFTEYSILNSTTASSMKRNLLTVTLNNQIYVLRYAYSQYLPDGSNTYIAVFNVKLSVTQTYGPTIYSFPPIDGASFGQSSFQLQNLVLKGQYLFIYDSSVSQIYKTQLTFQGLTIKLPKIGTIIVNTTVQGMDVFYDGQNYTLVYALTNSGLYEVDWTTNSPYNKYIYPWNSMMINLNKIAIGQQFIMSFFNNNSTTSIMEVYSRGMVSYPMIQFYNTSFFKPTSVLDMDQISGIIYSFGNSYSATNTNQMIQLQLPFLEFQSNSVGSLTNFILQCSSTYNNQSSQSSQTTFGVQTLQSGQISIESQSGSTVPTQTLQSSYPGEAYDDLSRYYKGPGLKYTFQSLNTNPWTPNAKIANIDNYYSKQNFKFVLSNGQTLDPSTITFLKQIQLFSGIYLWYIQDSSNVMYTFVQNYESNEEYLEAQQFQYQWSKQALNIELLEPWIAVFNEQGVCDLLFYNIYTETVFTKNLCDSSKYQITYFNLIGNQLFVSINDKNSSSSNRLNGQLLTATITLQDFISNSAFNQIQWKQFSSLAGLSNFYPQKVYQPWNSLYPIIYIQAEQQTIVFNSQYNMIYKQIVPTSTPYQLAFSQNFLILIQSNLIEQYQIYNPTQIYKTINYPTYKVYQNTPCYSTSQYGLQFSQNLTLVYDKCNSQIVVFAPQKDENQVSQYLIPVADFNYFTLARTYKIPNVISIIGKSSFNLINYYQFEFLQINAYMNAQSSAATQTYNFQIIVTSLFSSSTQSQTIPYTFVNTLDPLYSIHQSAQAQIDYGNYFIMNNTNQTKTSYQIYPYQWYKGMIGNFSLSCQFRDTNYLQSCNNLANVTQTFSKNRTLGGIPGYFNVLVKGNKFNYAQSSNKLFRIYNYTNNYFDFVQLPFNIRYGGSCYALAVSDNEQFAVSACLNGTWRLYITSFLSAEPTCAGSFEINSSTTAWSINKLIIKDLYVFVVFGGLSLKDGFDYVQILKLNFDQFSSTSLFTPITNFTLKANNMYYGTEQIITSLDIQKTQKVETYRFFITDYFGHLYTHLFNPTTPNAYFSNFLKVHLLYYLGPNIRSVQPLLTGFQIFNYNGATEDTYNGVLAFYNYHAFEVQITFSSSTQAFGINIMNQYQKYGIYEFTGNMDVMNNTNGFAVLAAILPDRFVHDPNYAQYPIQVLLAYDRSNNSFTAYNQSSVSYPQTIFTGSYNFKSDEITYPFLAQVFPSNNVSLTNFSVLLINPDTYKLDNMFIKRYIQIDMNTSISDQYWTLSLNAQNSLNYRNFKFSLQKELSGGGQLSTTQTCSGYQMFIPLTTTTSETTRFNLLDYFNGPNIAYSVNSSASNIANIPPFVQNLSAAQTQGIIPYYTAYRTYKPWNAFTKEWKQQMAVLYYDYVSSTYAIQQYNVPTTNSSMKTTGAPIILNFQADIICFDIEYLDQNTIIVDCHSPTKYMNYFAVVSNILSSPSIYYKSSIPYQSLTSPPLKRHIFLFQSSATVSYIFRCQYAEDYVSTDYQLATQTYIEQFSYSNQKIVQFFPITSSLLSLQQLQIDQLIVTPIGQLFILSQKVIYKISPSFLGLSLKPIEYDTYSSQYIVDIKRMALNFNGTQLVLYLALELSDNNYYIQEIDWSESQAMKLTNRIVLSQYLGQVTQMSVSNDFIIIAYNNQNFQHYASYLDVYSVAYGQNIYQQPFSNMQNFTHDRFNNYLLFFENTRSQSQNKQQIISISMPYLYIQSSQPLSQNTYSIGCTSSYYTLSNDYTGHDEIPNSPQATEPLMITVLGQNTVQLTAKQGGVYSSLVQTQAPGQAIMDLTQFYTGPAIQFTFSGTGSGQWPTDTKIYNLDNVYSNSSFSFYDSRNNKTIPVSSIIFFQQYSIAPDFMFWFLQDNTYTMYMFAEIIVDLQRIQMEPHPVSLSSKLLELDFATRDVSIVLEQNYNCTLYFYNGRKKALFSKNVCNSSSNSYISSFKVFQNFLYVLVQNGNDNFVNQVFFQDFNFHNNSAFSWLDWNIKIKSNSFLNIPQLTNFAPQKIYQSTLQPNIVIMKCNSYVLIFDQYTYHIYGQIQMSGPYQIAVTANDYLTIILPSSIIEYNFQNPLNIFESKTSYPSYAGNSFSVSDADIQRTNSLVYIHQAHTSQILVIQPGNPMLSVVQNTIPLNSNFQFFSVEKSFDNIFETIAAFGTNSLQIYNNYIQQSLEITAQNSATAGNLTFNISFQSQFESSPSHILNFTLQQTPNPQMFSIAQQQSATIDYAGFINVETFTGTGVFQFLPHQWYSGVITNYGINCTQSCQNNVVLQGPVGLQRQISKQPYFVDVKKGKSYTYAQSHNKVYRLATYKNQIFDMVPLPFATMAKKCHSLSVAPSEYYTLSACIGGDSWHIYMVSYLSAEPHVAGSFKAEFVYNVKNMIILNNYLFIIDAADEMKDAFYGIHIFYLNFTASSSFNTWANYIDTFTINSLSSLAIHSVINSIDIQQAELTNSFRFFLADSSNYLHTILFQPGLSNKLQYYQIQQSILMTHYLDLDAQKQKNIEFVGIKAFNAQITASTTSPQAIYSLIVVFKNFHSYEIKMSFSTQVVSTLLINKFLLNGLYQNQNNFDVMDYNNDGFFIVQGILPQRIAESSKYSSLPQQVLMVYDRTNGSQTQSPSSVINSTIIMATYNFNTQNPMLKFIGQIYPGSQTNYSILAISPVDFSFNNIYVQRNAQFVVNSIDFNDTSLDLVLSNSITNAKFTFNVTKEQGQNGTLASTSCTSINSFPSITLGVSEFYEYDLSNYFSGENLQFTVLPVNQTMVSINNKIQEYKNSGAYGILTEFNYMSILKTKNSSWISWDNYGVTLTQFQFGTPSYMATRYLLPTENTPISISGPQINFTLNSGTQCYEIIHVTKDIAVVDCIDMTNQVNNLVIIDFSKNSYTVQTQPWIQVLLKAPYWRNMHIMSTQSGMLYIFRGLYTADYQSGDEPQESAGFIEVFSFYNGKISELFPITAATLGLTLLEIQQFWVNQQSVYTYDRLTNKIYKITPNFLGLTYTTYQEDSYTVPGTFMKFTVSNDGSSVLVATTVNSIKYLYQVSWQKKSIAVQYLLDSNIKYISQIYGGQDFIAVKYDNSQNGIKFIGYIDIYQVYVPHVFYQRQISQVEDFLYKPFNNQIMIIYDTQNSKSNYISLWQISPQSLVLSATQALTQQSITIECSSVYYTINTTSRRALSPAINISFDFTVQPANTVVIKSIIPPGEQTLYTQYPGSLYFGVNYYSGPLLQYKIQNISLPTNTLISLQQNYQLYSNSQFNFTIGSQTLYPSDVTTFFDQIMIEPGVFLWVFQDKSYNAYKELIDIRSGTFNMIDMSEAQQSLSSQLINLQKVYPFVVAMALQGSPCVMNFVNMDKGYTYSKSFCTATNERIQNFNIFGNYIYIYTTQSNIYSAKLNLTQFFDYSGFQSIQWNLINNLIFDSALQTQLANCKPQQLFPYQSNGVFAIQCSSSVMIMNLQTLVYYTTITPKTTTAFIPAIVQSYLLLVEPANIEEYNLTKLSNIYKTKDYPTYASTTISYTKVTSCTYYAAIYEANSNTVFIVKPGESIFSVMVSTISVPPNVFFMQCMPGVETSILSIISSASNGGAVNIYKLYEANPQMVMNFGVNNQSTNLGAQFELVVSSSVSSQSLSSVHFNTIANNQTELTLSINSTNPSDFYSNLINLGYQKETNYFFDFKQQWLYHGEILNFFIDCPVKSECNTTIRMNNVIDWQRTIARTKEFTDVAQGHTGKFAYAQSRHEIWRFLGYMNELYDMVQLPLSDPNIYCMKLAVSELDQFAVSACSASDITSDFATPMENFWEIYVVSYISTEPFTMGSIPVQAQFINKMVILDKYLFIFDADESIDQYFNGVHVYQFNFDNFTLYPTWYQYLGTITRQQITMGNIDNIITTSFDVVKTAIPGRYRFIFSSIDGFMTSQTYDLTAPQPLTYFIEYYAVNVFPMLNNQQSSNANLQSIQLFDFQPTTSSSSGNTISQYSALFVFQNISSFEMILKFNENLQTLNFDNVAEYLQYGYYQSQPNPKIVDNFILFSGVLPEYLLQTSQATTAKQVLFVYQRNNASGTQLKSIQKTAGSVTTMLSSGYSFYNSLNQFQYSAQSYYNRTSTKTNYSILMINPDTNNLDRFWLKQNLTFEFVNNSVQSQNVDLYARNDFMTMYCGNFQIRINESPSGSSSHPYWVIGVVLGSVALIVILVFMYIQYRKKHKNNEGTEPLTE